MSPRSKAESKTQDPKSKIVTSFQSFQGLLARRGLHEARPRAVLRHGLSETAPLRQGAAALARTLPGRVETRLLHPEGDAAGDAGRHADETNRPREGDDQLRRRRKARDAA